MGQGNPDGEHQGAVRPIRPHPDIPDFSSANPPTRLPPRFIRWGNRPAMLWIAGDFGCWASGGWWNEVRVYGLKHQKEKRSMDHFAGLDVSVKETSVCLVDDSGKIVRGAKVAR